MTQFLRDQINTVSKFFDGLKGFLRGSVPVLVSSNKTIQIRLHGRGGGGTVTAAKILAEVSILLDGAGKIVRYAQAAPEFGPERGGAPVTASVRISPKHIRVRNPIAHPDYLLILDGGLMETFRDKCLKGFNGKWILINSSRDLAYFNDLGFNVAAVDATKIARELGLGKNVNTAMLGAFCRIAPDSISLEKLLFVTEEKLKNIAQEKIQKNLEAIRIAYELVKLKGMK